MEYDIVDKDDNLINLHMRIKIPNAWFEFCNSSDPFMRQYSGYWLYGADYREDLGWLCVDQEEANKSDFEKVHAIWSQKSSAQKSLKDLPKHWYRFDEKVAIKAYLEGVKRWGINWYTDPATDGDCYDTVIQMALLGEVKYG